MRPARGGRREDIGVVRLQDRLVASMRPARGGRRERSRTRIPSPACTRFNEAGPGGPEGVRDRLDLARRGEASMRPARGGRREARGCNRVRLLRNSGTIARDLTLRGFRVTSCSAVYLSKRCSPCARFHLRRDARETRNFRARGARAFPNRPEGYQESDPYETCALNAPARMVPWTSAPVTRDVLPECP